MRDLPDGLTASRQQAGMVSRRQVLAAGGSPEAIRTRLASGRWQSPWAGVYATFSGPLTTDARLWGAILRAGPGAVAGPWSSLWLIGVLDRPPDVLDVLVPAERRVRGVGQVRVRRRRGLAALKHPASSPPRLRIEAAVLQAAAVVSQDAEAIDLVLRAVQRRLTTAERLAEQLGRWPRHPRRGLLTELFTDVRHGVRSPLELRWVRTVERPHGLPTAALNRPDHDRRRLRYRDLEYAAWPLVIELDGREAHPDDERFRDRARDNVVTVSGRRSLRYGWREVTDDPCGVAAEVAAVLQGLGWTGRPRRCGPGCRIP
jgi:hypothetical protein